MNVKMKALLTRTKSMKSTDRTLPGTKVPYRNDMQRLGTYPQPTK